MKAMVLLTAALVTMAAGGFGVYQSGWFTAPAEAQPQGRTDDPLQSDAALRYKSNQGSSWRAVMCVRCD
jgi:hypothetical protein